MAEQIVDATKEIILGIQQGAESTEIKVYVIDGAITLELEVSRVLSEEPVEVERDKFELPDMPFEVGIRLRDFLNYAYPREEY